MKAEDLGIDVRTGYHDKRLTRAESKFLSILWGIHEGRENKLSADALAQKYAFELHGVELDPEALPVKIMDHWKREIRHMQNHILRDHNIPVLSKAGNDGGYWIAESEEEASEFYETFRKRGLTGLVKASRGKQAAVVDMVSQISFEFEELVDKTGFTSLIKPRARQPMPIEVVDAFLERMTGNPEKFADGLRKIGEKYGSILLPKDRVEAMKKQMKKLQEMVSSLGV
jgi:hypothetical protein